MGVTGILFGLDEFIVSVPVGIGLGPGEGDEYDRAALALAQQADESGRISGEEEVGE